MTKKIKLASDYIKELLEEGSLQGHDPGENTEFIDFHKSIENMMTSGYVEKSFSSKSNIFQTNTAKQL